MPIALITGASRGLGLALARSLAADGWTLVIDGREAEPLQQAAAELGSGAVAIPGDVADPAGSHLDEPPIEPLPPDLPGLAVAEHLAAYNLIAAPVCDADGRLLGAVSVDDVLDFLLPRGWRDAVSDDGGSRR